MVGCRNLIRVSLKLESNRLIMYNWNWSDQFLLKILLHYLSFIYNFICFFLFGACTIIIIDYYFLLNKFVIFTNTTLPTTSYFVYYFMLLNFLHFIIIISKYIVVFVILFELYNMI